VALLLVDSIAAIFRGEFELDEMNARADTLLHFARELKRLSDMFHLAVVCINQVRPSSFDAVADRREAGAEDRVSVEPSSSMVAQVSDFVSEQDPDPIAGMHGFGERRIPALGLSWSNAVNMRIMLRRITSRHSASPVQVRHANVARCWLCPPRHAVAG
jgi:DNA-repair protein XRCC3